MRTTFVLVLALALLALGVSVTVTRYHDCRRVLGHGPIWCAIDVLD